MSRNKPSIKNEVRRLLAAQGWWESGDNFSESLMRWQAWIGLPISKDVTAAALHFLRSGAMPYQFCGLKNAIALRATEMLCRWGQKLVTWHVQSAIPGLSLADTQDAIAWGAELWNSVSGIQFTFMAEASAANVLINGQALDGPGKTLADMKLPCGLPREGVIHGRIDTSELWYAGPPPWPTGRVPLREVMLHELGHAMGIGHHAPGSAPGPAIMDPSINTALTTLQKWDIDEAQKRAGKPAPERPTLRHFIIRVDSPDAPTVEQVSDEPGASDET